MTSSPRTFLLLAAGLFLLWDHSLGHAESPADRDIKIIGVLLYDGVLTSDVTAPLEVFGAATRRPGPLEDYRVLAIAPRGGVITTNEGLRLEPDVTLDEAPDLEALIVGSAYNMSPILDDTKVIDFIRSHGRKARWLGSNCSGAHLLAKAGLLEGQRVTTYPGGEALLEQTYPGTEVVRDTFVVSGDRIVTSNGGLVSYEAAFRLLELMGGAELAQSVSGDLYYGRLLAANAITPIGARGRR